MPYIKTTDNIKLYVKDWGHGRPVVMMHGWPLSADTFDDLGMAIASAGMRAIAYDRRGFGRSDQPWEGYVYDTLADDLAAAVGKIGAVTTGFLFPVLLASMGTTSVLYILVVTSLIGAVVTWIFRIETKGVNLDQIGRSQSAARVDVSSAAPAVSGNGSN